MRCEHVNSLLMSNQYKILYPETAMNTSLLSQDGTQYHREIMTETKIKTNKDGGWSILVSCPSQNEAISQILSLSVQSFTLWYQNYQNKNLQVQISCCLYFCGSWSQSFKDGRISPFAVQHYLIVFSNNNLFKKQVIKHLQQKLILVSTSILTHAMLNSVKLTILMCHQRDSGQRC